MIIKDVLIEHWPRLQCVNCLITFKNALDEPQRLQVCTLSSELIIEHQNHTVIIECGKYLEFKSNSLSLLLKRSNCLSFRLNTNMAHNFDQEHLLLNELESINKFETELLININRNEDFVIKCKNCKVPLTSTLCFRRILELPSEKIDMSDWFCHNHLKPDQKSDGTKFNFTKIAPNSGDLLYGTFFILLSNNDIDIKTDRNGENIINCKKCCNYIGDFIVQNGTCKIWNENVLIEKPNDSQDHNRSIFSIDNLKNCFEYIIQKLLKDFSFITDSGLQYANKILLEARDENERKKYLLIQIMKRDLNIYTIDQITNDLITIKPEIGIKLMYRVEDDPNQALLEFWQQDANVCNQEISCEMFDQAVLLLNDNTKFIEEEYRYCSGFQLSYLFNVKKVF